MKDRLSPTITGLVIVNTVVFAFYALVKELRPFVDSHLAMTGAAVLAGEVWQPVTSLFVHVDPISFFFNIIGLWFVGATIERELGRRRFLAIFFGAAIAGNLAIALISAARGSGELWAGASLGVIALFVAFGTHFDRMPARVLGGLVLEARYLTLILIGFSLVADITRGSLAGLVGDVVAITLAYVLAGGRGAFVRAFFDRFSGGGGGRKGGKRKFQVHEGGRRGGRSDLLN